MQNALILKSLVCGFYVFLTVAALAQDFASLRSAGKSSPAERCRAVLQSNMNYVDSATFMARYDALLDISIREKDRKTQWLLEYHRFKNRSGLKLKPEQIAALLSRLDSVASAEKWPVETVVAQHYERFEQSGAKKIRYEQLFAYLLDEYSRMEELGLERFRDYDVADLMYHGAQFMYDLEDYDKALQFLHAGERFLDTRKTRRHILVLTLNHLQTIYQQRKEFAEAERYAQKILQGIDTIQTADPGAREFCLFWRGLTTINLASMLVERHQFAEGEKFADEGYASIKSLDAENNNQALAGQFDALLPLASIKLTLKKNAEAETMIRQAENLWENHLKGEAFYYFRPIRLWELSAQLAEAKGDFAAALRYRRFARPLQDSLDRLTDARKLEKIQQRVSAQKYSEKIRLIESEKQFQSQLLYAAVALLGLVLLFAAYNFRRLQRKREQALTALDSAQKDLEVYIRYFREKSELADNLRLEITAVSAIDARSQHLHDLLQRTILTEADWLQFRVLFEKVYPDFIRDQKTEFPELTQAEMRYLVLEKLRLGTREMANMLGVSDGTIRQTRSRLRKKTGGNPAADRQSGPEATWGETQ